MDIYRPYTYLVGWTKLNRYYYGVRFARNCNPGDLWVKYFTSSKIVKSLREQHGEPDIIKVRKIFDNKEAAISWEEKVLRRIGVLEKDIWLNRNIAGAIPPHLGGMKNKGRQRSPEASAKAAATRKARNIPSSNKGKKIPQISQALKGRPNPNKGKKYGPLSDTAKAKMKEAKRIYYASGNKGPNAGKILSEDQKSKISQALIGQSKPDSHREKLRAIAKTRYKITKDDGTWTWGYKKE